MQRETVGQRFCAALGLDPSRVASLTIEVLPTHAVALVRVPLRASDVDASVAVLASADLPVRELPPEQGAGLAQVADELRRIRQCLDRAAPVDAVPAMLAAHSARLADALSRWSDPSPTEHLPGRPRPESAQAPAAAGADRGASR